MSFTSNYATLCIVLSLVIVTSGLKLHIGRCPHMKVQQNFNASSYMGVWYEQSHYNTAQFEGLNASCVTAQYSLNSTTGVVNVTNTAINQPGSYKVQISGTAVLDDPSKDEAKLTVTFDIAGTSVQGMYWVLETDYTNYSVVYACTNHYLIFHSYTVWYLGRDQEFSDTSAKTAFFNSTDSVLRSHGLKPKIMTLTSQTNCTV